MTGKMLRMVLLALFCWLGGSGLVVGAILHPIVPGGWYLIFAALAWFVVPVSVLARGLARRSSPSAAVRLVLLRPFWYAMLLLPLLALTGSVGVMVGWPFGAAGAVGRWTLAGAACVLTILLIAGYRGSRRLVVKALDVRMPRLPDGFEGLTVAQISDLHVGPQTSVRHLAAVLEAVQRARPDLIVITGDQVDDFAEDVRHFVLAFRSLSAPLGVVAIPGNHDIYGGWEIIAEGLMGAGIQVVVNSAIPLQRGGERLWLAGTGDPAGRMWSAGGGAAASPDITKTLERVPAGEPVVVLAHNPGLWPTLVARQVDLTLSGHTHYGQLAIPSRAWCLASPFLEFAMGSYRQGHSLLYINPGTNFWGIPFRLGTPPEVTLLTLRRGPPGISERTPPTREQGEV